MVLELLLGVAKGVDVSFDQPVTLPAAVLMMEILFKECKGSFVLLLRLLLLLPLMVVLVPTAVRVCVFVFVFVLAPALEFILVLLFSEKFVFSALGVVGEGADC
jgi:hypothetical protein